MCSNGQTPLYEQVRQLVVLHHQRTCWALARPASNKFYNLLACWALVLPEPNKLSWLSGIYQPTGCQLVGQLVRTVEFGHNVVLHDMWWMLCSVSPLS
jgi:hypothetical protein